ncbi:hypothetical protein A8B79_13925 [Balneola sp. EhC07]|uniref:hypothetical protein n=1 Tax=Balneola sp. EhC07 TaxID=1849360 RepID=UPI0007F55283|nr:hypothetical protein [Balneola sp. EhC07]OAN64429.1 hypothetical protein A8B79_13925 [Balneola sp. EhC07]
MKGNITLCLLITLGIVFFNSIETKSQTIELGFWSGFGSYNHSSLRKISAQDYSQNNIPNLSNTDYLPFGYAYGIHLDRVYQVYSFGLFFRHEKSRTERSYYNILEDLYYNQNGSNLVFGLQGKLHLKNQIHNNLSYFPYFSLKSGLNISSISYSEKLERLPSNSLGSFEITSQSFFIEPGFGVRVYDDLFIIEPTLSFFVPVLQSSYKINDEMTLKNQTEENRENTNFLGVRLGITFGLKLN